ncbi:hypothetical protein [Methylocystis bryophila]|uniref:Type II secretion system protein GspC N-terminal domain-containing protein n=1 Tax=Methylocystis bryophila TaxID=655015 RepID=A0A1W6MXC7_9HYPH|nr:hypothetical protein [Methylocystis bryophila]ARN82223.1 hypothetical protein B1812_15280 [Methylocystis bryophila]BDV38357.1 hypothetical protein DSM21852_16100 [Methylocystis bryophila]
MRDLRATPLLERLSALTKSWRLSSPLSPEILAGLSALARSKRLPSPLSPLFLARVSAFAKAKRLSPLMLATLSLLSVTTTLSALFFLRALIGWDLVAPSAIADWRPPSASFLNSSESKAPPTDTETLARPVFAKSRRPIPKAAATPAQETQSAGPPPAVTVQALVLSSGGWRAYLAGRGDNKGDWYQTGQIVDGWTISEIHATDLTLKSGERTEILSLYPETPASAEGEAKPSPLGASGALRGPPGLPPGPPPVEPRLDRRR